MDIALVIEGKKFRVEIVGARRKKKNSLTPQSVPRAKTNDERTSSCICVFVNRNSFAIC